MKQPYSITIKAKLNAIIDLQPSFYLDLLKILQNIAQSHQAYYIKLLDSKIFILKKSF